MRLLTLVSVAACAAAAAGAAAAQSPSLEIRDAVVRVVVVPEARNDIAVEVLSRNAELPLEVRTKGDRTVIDGRLSRRIRSCHGSGGAISVDVGGVGDVSWSQIPQILVRVPRDAVVGAGGAVFGSVGRSESLEISNAGCGDWTVANVTGRLRYNQAGSGDARIGSSGEASIRVAGSGDVSLRAVARKLEIDLAGSGDVDAAQVSGPVDVKIAGSGDVRVESGQAGPLTVSIAGSGGVDFGASAESLKARIVGSGDVKVKSVRGAVEKTVLGSGAVSIG